MLYIALIKQIDDLKVKTTTTILRPILKKTKQNASIAGEIVVDGTDFRNNAHFRFKADLFVPCGGR